MKANQLSFLVTSLILFKMCTSDDYLQKRRNMLKLDQKTFTGHDLELSQRELRLNTVLLVEKLKELQNGYVNESAFLPLQNFPDARSKIDETYVFKLIKSLPKGASLHTHLLGGVSIDFVVKHITYLKNLYGGYVNSKFKLKFFNMADVDPQIWTPLPKLRAGNPNFDLWLKEELTLAHSNAPKEEIWAHFKDTFTVIYDMVSYKPVFEMYLYEFLHELHEDNVFYAEIRGTIMPLYDLSGIPYSPEDFFNIITQVVNKFKKDHPNFLGMKYIHSVFRGVDNEKLSFEVKELVELQKKFPQLIAGLDLVGFEDLGKNLVDFHEELKMAGENLSFYFHAGETNWYGQTDLNLIDAILLNSKRIGHGLALSKHPYLVQEIKNKNIAIELCPLSNQMLLLQKDPRSHPIIPLLAQNVSVVICNDDPSIWGATGISYDWYVVFMAMTPKNMGLKILKQFALNSISYSAMSSEEKNMAFSLWEKFWNQFLESQLN